MKPKFKMILSTASAKKDIIQKKILALRNNPPKLTICLCQFKPKIGQTQKNAKRMIKKMVQAADAKTSLIVFGEDALQGYGLDESCIKNQLYWQTVADAENKILSAADRMGIAVVFGRFIQKTTGIYNALRFYDPNSKTNYTQYKVLIPAPDIGDEYKFIKPGPINKINYVDFKGHRIAFNICQDSWKKNSDTHDPFQQAMSHKPKIFINLSASPYYKGKPEKIIQPHFKKLSAKNHKVLFLYAPIVGHTKNHVRLSGGGLQIRNGIIEHKLPLFKETCYFLNTSQ